MKPDIESPERGDRVAGKVAIVTGAARGQGRMHAELLAAQGAAVVLGDVLDDEGQEAAQAIVEAGGRAAYANLDVGSSAAWELVVEMARDRFGPPTVLVNNAGVATRSAVLETESEEWELAVAVNQRGVFLGMKHCLNDMTAAGGGSIVNISSTLGISGGTAAASYQATKHAVIGLTRSAARTYGPQNVRTNAVCPGLVVTPMTMTLDDPDEAIERLIPQIPLRRAGKRLEVSRVVLFLASDESSYVNGAQITVDGGMVG